MSSPRYNSFTVDRNLNEYPEGRRHQLTGQGQRGKKSRRRKSISTGIPSSCFLAAVKRAALLCQLPPQQGNSESKEDAFHPCGVLLS